MKEELDRGGGFFATLKRELRGQTRNLGPTIYPSQVTYLDNTCTFLLQLHDQEGCDDLNAKAGCEGPGNGQVERDKAHHPQEYKRRLNMASFLFCCSYKLCLGFNRV